MIDNRQYRYVSHIDLPSWEAVGWRVVDDFGDCHHGAHAVMIELVDPCYTRGPEWELSVKNKTILAFDD